MIPELELPNSKKASKSKDKPMKDINTDKHRQRFGIFIASIFAFTLGFIFFQIQTERPLDGEWKELILVLIGALIGNFGKIIDFWFGHRPTNNHEE
jgi:hypothetical protein